MKADNNSKRFTELKELLEIVKNKIDHIEIRQTGQSASISLVKDQLSVMNSKLDVMSETLDAHTGSLIIIENTLKGYGDMYKINDFNVRKMQKRLETLEDQANIEVPPELQLADVA